MLLGVLGKALPNPLMARHWLQKLTCGAWSCEYGTASPRWEISCANNACWPKSSKKGRSAMSSHLRNMVAILAAYDEMLK